MERISVVFNVVGISEVEGWNRSGYVAPMDQRQRDCELGAKSRT